MRHAYGFPLVSLARRLSRINRAVPVRCTDDLLNLSR